MKVTLEETGIEDLYVLNLDSFDDQRGFFREVFRHDEFKAAGLPTQFAQLNHSRSARNVLRGLHFQWDAPMGKLMRVVQGKAFMAAVDIRKNSPTLGHWFGTEFSADNHRQLWAPAGFARGFCALSDFADVEYLCTATYNPDGESGIRWDDPTVSIQWPVTNPILSNKDGMAQSFDEWLERDEAANFDYDIDRQKGS